MIINLSEQQSDFLEELLLNSLKEFQEEKARITYQLNHIAQDYSKPSLKFQLKNIDNYLNNIKELLEILQQNEN